MGREDGFNTLHIDIANGCYSNSAKTQAQENMDRSKSVQEAERISATYDHALTIISKYT